MSSNKGGRPNSKERMGKPNQKVAHQSTPQQSTFYTIPSLTAHVHKLIRTKQASVMQYMTNNMSVQVRGKVATELIRNETCLSLAIEADDLELVTYLIEKCECNVDVHWLGKVTCDGETHSNVKFSPLVKAILHRNTLAVSQLLNYGANPNATNDLGYTALHAACAVGDFEIVKLLVQAGSDVNAKTKQGTTALMNARLNPKIRKYLIKQGADTEETNIYGRTALHQAAMEGCDKSVRLLIKHGAKTSVQGVKGNTPLHLAVYNKHKEVVQILVDAGADLYARNSDKEDSFLLAASNGFNLEILLNEHHKCQE